MQRIATDHMHRFVTRRDFSHKHHRIRSHAAHRNGPYASVCNSATFLVQTSQHSIRSHAAHRIGPYHMHRLVTRRDFLYKHHSIRYHAAHRIGTYASVCAPTDLVCTNITASDRMQRIASDHMHRLVHRLIWFVQKSLPCSRSGSCTDALTGARVRRRMAMGRACAPKRVRMTVVSSRVGWTWSCRTPPTSTQTNHSWWHCGEPKSRTFIRGLKVRLFGSPQWLGGHVVHPRVHSSRGA